MRMKFKGNTSFRPEWWFTIEHGKVYDVTTSRTWDGINAIVRNDSGQSILCPYSSIEAFNANWEEFNEPKRGKTRCPYCQGHKWLEYDAFETKGIIRWGNDGKMSIDNSCGDFYYDFYEEFDIKYCPMCGRKLGE